MNDVAWHFILHFIHFISKIWRRYYFYIIICLNKTYISQYIKFKIQINASSENIIILLFLSFSQAHVEIDVFTHRRLCSSNLVSNASFILPVHVQYLLPSQPTSKIPLHILSFMQSSFARESEPWHLMAFPEQTLLYFLINSEV